MARPIRCRRICFEPEYNSFAPCGMESTEQVLLMVDEFEAVRLIDYEKRTHEQCAKQMGVSRTTVTEMYETYFRSYTNQFFTPAKDQWPSPRPAHGFFPGFP